MLIIGIFADTSPVTAKSGALEESDSFKVAILPDTQKYARYKNEISMSQTQWVKKNAEQENIVFTSHLGDIVDRVNEGYEWQNADEVMQVLDKAKIPYGYLAGNHGETNAEGYGYYGCGEYDLRRTGVYVQK